MSKLLIVGFMAAIVVITLTACVPIQPQKTDEPTFVSADDAVLNFVSGTEYKPGQQGQVIVEARYPNGTSALNNQITYIYGNFSNNLYDAALIDQISIFTPLWNNGGSTGGICIWANNNSGYFCGCPTTACTTASTVSAYGVKGMERKLATQFQLLGLRTTFDLVRICSGGSCTQGNSFMWIGDFNSTLDAAGRQEGVTIDMDRWTIYQRHNGSLTVLYDAPDPVFCSPFPICGTYTHTIDFYVLNGRAIMKSDGVTVIDVQTNYTVGVNTTYGWNGANIATGTVHQSSLLYSRQIYDAINGTAALPAVNCKASVWNPDKTPFITNQTMLLSSPSGNITDNDGNGYIHFTVPGSDGVYEYQSTCVVGNRSLVASHSFHVTKPRISAVTTK